MHWNWDPYSETGSHFKPQRKWNQSTAELNQQATGNPEKTSLWLQDTEAAGILHGKSSGGKGQKVLKVRPAGFSLGILSLALHSSSKVQSL